MFRLELNNKSDSHQEYSTHITQSGQSQGNTKSLAGYSQTSHSENFQRKTFKLFFSYKTFKVVLYKLSSGRATFLSADHHQHYQEKEG